MTYTSPGLAGECCCFSAAEPQEDREQVPLWLRRRLRKERKVGTLRYHDGDDNENFKKA